MFLSLSMRSNTKQNAQKKYLKAEPAKEAAEIPAWSFLEPFRIPPPLSLYLNRSLQQPRVPRLNLAIVVRHRPLLHQRHQFTPQTIARKETNRHLEPMSLPKLPRLIIPQLHMQVQRDNLLLLEPGNDRVLLLRVDLLLLIRRLVARRSFDLELLYDGRAVGRFGLRDDVLDELGREALSAVRAALLSASYAEQGERVNAREDAESHDVELVRLGRDFGSGFGGTGGGGGDGGDDGRDGGRDGGGEEGGGGLETADDVANWKVLVEDYARGLAGSRGGQEGTH